MKRYISLLAISLAMQNSTIPVLAQDFVNQNQTNEFEVQEITRDVIYVKSELSTVKTESGKGTKEDPYKLLTSAIENASSGAEIIIDGRANLTEPNGVGTGFKPFIIDKDLTFIGINDAILSNDYAGLILGGNVTFKNIKFGFRSLSRDHIFANGYNLKLENCTVEKSLRNIDIFGGSSYNKDNQQLTEAINSSGKVITYFQGPGSNIIIDNENEKM